MSARLVGGRPDLAFCMFFRRSSNSVDHPSAHPFIFLFCLVAVPGINRGCSTMSEYTVISEISTAKISDDADLEKVGYLAFLIIQRSQLHVCVYVI